MIRFLPKPLDTLGKNVVGDLPFQNNKNVIVRIFRIETPSRPKEKLPRLSSLCLRIPWRPKMQWWDIIHPNPRIYCHWKYGCKDQAITYLMEFSMQLHPIRWMDWTNNYVALELLTPQKRGNYTPTIPWLFWKIRTTYPRFYYSPGPSSCKCCNSWYVLDGPGVECPCWRWKSIEFNFSWNRIKIIVYRTKILLAKTCQRKEESTPTE
jgi:hypothetical protein